MENKGYMSKIIKRRIHVLEAELLVEKIKFTPNIIGYTIEEWLDSEHVFIAEDQQGQLLGACLNYDIARDWTKIAALYVLDEFRKQGIGKALFYESFNDSMKRCKHVYTISCNPLVISLMKELEFTMFNSLQDFPASYVADQADFYIHTLQWLTSPYRIMEITRKQFVCRPQQPFLYGLKSCSMT
jgi:predicted GNAT family acetyltransferase